MTELTEGAGPSRPLACPSVSMVSSGLLIRADHVVFAILDRFAAQYAVELIPVPMLVSPLSHCLEHITLNLNVIVSDGRVVKCAEDVIDDFVDRNICMFPCVQNTTGRGLVSVYKQGLEDSAQLTVRYIAAQSLRLCRRRG